MRDSNELATGQEAGCGTAASTRCGTRPSEHGPAVRHALAAAALFVCIQLPGLDRLPAFGGDEVYYAEPGFNLASRGRFAVPSWGSVRGFDRIFMANVPGYPILLASVYALFGLGVWQTRLPALAAGAASIVLTMRLARRSGGTPRAALVSGLLLAVSPSFVQACRDGRPDTTALCFALASVVSVLSTPRSGSRAWPLFTGLLAGSAVMVHVAVAPVPLACSALLARRTAREARCRALAFFALGMALPCVPWMILAAVQHEAFRDQFLALSARNSVLGQNPVRLLVAELVARYGAGYRLAPFWALLTGCVLAGWLWYGVVRRKMARACGAVWCCQFLFFALAKAKDGGGYLAYTEPYVAVLASCLMERLGSAHPMWNERREWRAKPALALAALVMLLGLGNGMALIAGRYGAIWKQWSARDYAATETKLRDLVPAHARILAHQSAWLALRRLGADPRILTQGGPVQDFFDTQYDPESVRSFEWVVLQPDYRRPGVEPVWSTVTREYELVAELRAGDAQAAAPLAARDPYHFLVFQRRSETVPALARSPNGPAL
jgi:4-amino-4-deoxy-L-arabinose transferase-like glycosyltransferase